MLYGSIDIRKDFPKYRIFKNGKLEEESIDIESIWSDDFVSFIIGCSFSFEDALIKAGLEVRNVTENKNVPMYMIIKTIEFAEHV